VSAKPLTGQTALITGAAKRLGRAVALALAEEGVNVVVHHNASVAEAQALCEELCELGVDAWTLRADLGSREESETLIDRARQVAGPLDILINNAAIFPSGTLRDITFDDVVANVQVNAWAPFALSRAFAGQAQRGKIVNLLDSKLARYDWAHAAYILSKHMLAVLTRMTALEFAPDITVNAVAPGLILPPRGEDESYLERVAPMLPLKRHGAPRDIAEAALFLLKSDFITGQVIYVDGGAHLRELANGPNSD
jgi:pteridine reductase